MMNIGVGELLLLSMMCLVPLLGVVVVVLLVRGTQKKTNLGINLAPPTQCPACATPLPMVRAPKNFRQMMWGGWTCQGCQLELDKWGRPLPK